MHGGSETSSRLRELRRRKGYTQQKLAKYLYVGQNSYSCYETGLRDCPIDVLTRLADFYGVSVDYLLGRTSVKEPYPKK